MRYYEFTEEELKIQERLKTEQKMLSQKGFVRDGSSIFEHFTEFYWKLGKVFLIITRYVDDMEYSCYEVVFWPAVESHIHFDNLEEVFSYIDEERYKPLW